MPAVLQIEDKEHDFNRYYHAAGDSYAHMDHDYFLDHVRALGAIVARVAGIHVQAPRPDGLLVPYASTGPR